MESKIRELTDLMVEREYTLAQAQELISKALVGRVTVINYGNQTKVAEQLKCNRATVRKHLK